MSVSPKASILNLSLQLALRVVQIACLLVGGFALFVSNDYEVAANAFVFALGADAWAYFLNRHAEKSVTR